MASGKRLKLTPLELQRNDSHLPLVQIRVVSCGFVDGLVSVCKPDDPRNHTKQHEDNCGDPKIAEVTQRLLLRRREPEFTH
jgi:hypothetical protein